MDVTALYSNTDHEKGISCTYRYLSEDNEVPEVQKNFLIDGLSLILKNNFFLYNRYNLPSKKDNRYGSYANLFMGCFGKAHIDTNNPYNNNIWLYKRYMNNLFFSVGRKRGEGP